MDDDALDPAPPTSAELEADATQRQAVRVQRRVLIALFTALLVGLVFVGQVAGTFLGTGGGCGGG